MKGDVIPLQISVDEWDGIIIYHVSTIGNECVKQIKTVTLYIFSYFDPGFWK